MSLASKPVTAFKRLATRSLLSLSTLACVSFVTPASASVMGILTEASCAGGGVTVTLTTITFSPNGTLPNTGCIDSGINTSLTYSGGTLLPGNIGNILDLSILNPFPFNQFMTFSGTSLDFVLTGLGPGVANTNCALTDAPGSNITCSAVANSPFILSNAGSGNTGISLKAFGTITDNGVTSNWNGSFTTQLTQTAVSIQSTEVGGGSIGSAQSAQFTATVAGVPEPSSIFLGSLGIVMLLVGARFRKPHGGRV
jgi:hypothetical protein